jgi:hypothetical protein
MENILQFISFNQPRSEQTLRKKTLNFYVLKWDEKRDPLGIEGEKDDNNIIQLIMAKFFI